MRRVLSRLMDAGHYQADCRYVNIYDTHLSLKGERVVLNA